MIRARAWSLRLRPRLQRFRTLGSWERADLSSALRKIAGGMLARSAEGLREGLGFRVWGPA